MQVCTHIYIYHVSIFLVNSFSPQKTQFVVTFSSSSSSHGSDASESLQVIPGMGCYWGYGSPKVMMWIYIHSSIPKPQKGGLWAAFNLFLRKRLLRPCPCFFGWVGIHSSRNDDFRIAKCTQLHWTKSFNLGRWSGLKLKDVSWYTMPPVWVKGLYVPQDGWRAAYLPVKKKNKSWAG